MVCRSLSVLMLCYLVGGYGIVLGQPTVAVRSGDLVYQTDFDQGKGLSGWTGAGKLDQSLTRGMVLYVCQPSGPAANPTVSQISIPCEKYRGCLVLMSAIVKGENMQVVGPDVKNRVTCETIRTRYHAAKFEVTAGNERYRGAISAGVCPPRGNTGHEEAATGTFDWKQAAVRVFVPWDATTMTITLGLEAGVTGKIWFDDVKIQVRQVDAFPKGKVQMGPWKFPRLRGSIVDPRSRPEEDFRVLGGEWKANVLRWPTYEAPGYTSSADDPAHDAWLNREMKRLDDTLPVLRKYGIRVVIAMFGAPGGGQSWEGSAMFDNLACQQKFIKIWKTLARHYKGVKGVFGYDLANEPMDALGLDNVGWDAVPGDVYNWWELADKAARAIREIDPETPIIMEPSPGGIPYAFHGAIPLNVPNVVYSLHMYMPYQFTHQRAFPFFDKTFRYPGFEVLGEIWDRDRVRAMLQNVVDFQQKWGARIYVGEFSAARWAPGACNYLKDITDVFEANGWDWTYHAFRESDFWNVELSEDKDHPVQKVTDRQKLLRQLFSKNEKPSS
jgi:endoglucanase